MRLLHLTPRYWPAVGGGENVLQEISTRFVADGHAVTIATTDALDFDLLWNAHRRRLPDLEAEHAGVRVRRFPVRHWPFTPYSYILWRFYVLRLLEAVPITPLAWLKQAARFTPWVPQLWHWVETTSERFDLVMGTTVLYEPLLWAGMRLARRQGIPFIVCPFTHLGAGSQPGRDTISRFYTMRQQVGVVCASDAVVAQTESERDFYIVQGMSPAKIMVAGPGINPADVLGGDGLRFRDRHQLRGPLVAFLATLTPDKGAIHLVEAVRGLWRAGREVELIMAGAVTTAFQHYLNRLPEIDRRRLRVLGPISEADKKDLLAACDVFAMPSRTDSFGITYLEAWLYGKPVIGARAWGIGDVIADGQDGVLVPFGCIDDLAQTMARLLDAPDQRQAMGAAGRHKVLSRHLWSAKYALWRDLYQQVAGQP